jgi:hydrophobe/amphiphile efflux-1 (HAE1) family protein
MILPMIDVPVALIGTLAVMKLMGFTLNTLTLFGLVLAIGIVVDDAIMVLENIERWMAQGLDARTATLKAMQEITGPIIAVTLVLCAVFLPSAFLGGITGQFFRQFALTIAASMMISAINAMTMTPSRAVSIFKGGHHDKEALPSWGVALVGGLLTWWAGNKLFGDRLGLAKAVLDGRPFDWAVWAAFFLPGAAAGWVVGKPLIRPVNRVLAVVFGGFNRLFDFATGGYARGVGGLLRLSVLVLVVYMGLLGLTGFGLVRVPGGFIPQQDKGYLIVGLQLPDAASVERTEKVVQTVNRIILGDEEQGGRYWGPKPAAGSKLYPPIPGVAHTVALDGYSLLTSSVGSNFGSMFVVLDPFEQRAHGPHADVVLTELRRRLAEVEEADVVAFGAPPVDGLGNASGFKMQVRDVGAAGLLTLQLVTDDLVRTANATPGLAGVYTSFRANSPQLSVRINEDKALSMGVPVGEINDALQVFLGSKYVNDVTLFDRNFQVNVQADPGARVRADDVRKLKVRNQDGQMVPLGTVLDVKESSGPATVFRFNTRPAAAVSGGTVPGFSTGQAIAAMQAAAAKELPPSLDYQWSELTRLEIDASKDPLNMLIFPLAVMLVFLILAFQYESWTMPLAVILVVPLCVLCAVAGVAAVGGDINIFTRIGFVVLAGLASKNAILIVEFAKVKYEEGASAFDAAVEACRVRLRPIVMTSFAFILGVLPLLLGHGAGAEMRFALGIAVFAGMLGVTAFGIFMTPVFFYVIQWLVGGRRGEAKTVLAPAGADGGAAAPAAPETAIQPSPQSPHG